MEVEDQDVEGQEKLVDSEEKKNLECTPKIIIIIVFANLAFISVNVVLIRFLSLSKVDYMSTIMNDFVKDYTKSAITENRILHLIKSTNNSNASVRYQELVEIQKLVFNATYEFLNSSSQFKNLLEEMNDVTFNNIFPGYDKSQSSVNTIENHYKVLTQPEDWRIYQLMDNYDLKTINDAIYEKKGDKYKEQLKIMILYGLINLPFQVLYFSKNDTIKYKFQEAIIKKIKANMTEKINHSMQKLEENKTLMVLGCDQDEEKNRIDANFTGYKIPNNLINVGLRTELTESEGKETRLKLNIEKYISGYLRNLMKDCSAKDLDDQEFEEFIKELNNLKDKCESNKDKIKELFRKYAFSVETANTVINYNESSIERDKIHIIRLSSKNSIDEIKYNSSDYFILYNIIDVSTSGDTNITRATTFSNAKVIKYLKQKYPNFLTKEEYNNLVLISTRGDAERQLEAFNIASNLTNITDENNQIMKWNQVVWNEYTNKTDLSAEEVANITLEAMVKSYNLIATNSIEKLKDKDYLYNLANNYTALIKKYQNTTNITI